MNGIVLAQRDLDAIIEHARSGDPNEVCGLVGVHDARVLRVLPTRNAAVTPRNRFEIDSRDLIQVIAFEREGLHVGFYHSHPASVAYPSATDVAFAELWPGSLNLMVSLRHDRPGGVGPEFHAYRIFGSRIEEISVTITADHVI